MTPQVFSLIIIFLLFSMTTLYMGESISRSRERLIKIGLTHSEQHSFTSGFKEFQKCLEERSQGRLRVKIFHSAQVGSEREMQEMLTLGTLDMTVTGVVNLYEPLFAVFEMPYLYQDRAHVIRAMESPAMQTVAESLVPKGLRLIGFFENGFRHITNSVRAIHHPADLKGLRIRVPENIAQFVTFQTFGTVPTSMSFSELYMALSQGMMDGQENPLQNIYQGSLYNVQQHLAMTRHIYNAAYVLMSERLWGSLKEEDRKLIQECMDQATLWQLSHMVERDRELEGILIEKGMEFTYPDLTEFERAAQPAYNVIYNRLGPRAREIVEEIRSLEN